MPKLDEKQERGLAFIGNIMGESFDRQMRESAESTRFGSGITRMALGFAFEEAWGHDGLDRRSKSIAIVSTLIAMHQLKELKNHVKIGIANGVTVREFEGLLVQLVPYVGFPRIASATTAVIEALREAGKDPNVQTSEERGLL
jgi:4-carboxymuconolactone decarboxylase